MVITQGDIWWANLSDPIGSAPGFRRPVIVVQCDAFNQSRIATVLCVSLTSNMKWAKAPGNVLLKSSATGLDRDSVANPSLTVTLDKAQLEEWAGRLTKAKLSAVFAGIDTVLGR